VNDSRAVVTVVLCRLGLFTFTPSGTGREWAQDTDGDDSTTIVALLSKVLNQATDCLSTLVKN
jgi:hypothetical protein